MAKLGDLIVRVGADTTPLNTALGNVTRTMRQSTGNIQKLGRNMSIAITAPLVAIGATSFKVAAEFEQSMAKVRAVSGATGEEFKSLQDNAKELGRTTRFTASEVSALQLEFAKLGFSAQEITEVTEATLNLAQATGSDLAQSAEVAGATLRAFGLDASETSRVTDVMAASFSTSALDIDSFQDSMKFVAPVAKAAGVSLEEATAMLGQLANNGIKGSTAGTSLRRILQEIAGTGQPFAEAMKKSADEVINLADAKDEVGRTASSAFLVLKEGMGDVQGLTTELQGATGAAAEMAAIMDDTAEGAMKRMQSAIEGAQIEIGTALAPIMIKLAGIVADLAQKFSTMSDGGQAMVFALSAVFGAIGPILLILPSLTLGLDLAKVSFASLNTTMRANPFGVVATAITLVVTGIMLLKDETVKAVTAVDALTEANKNLTLEEQKRNIEVQIEQQKKLVEQLEAEKAAKDKIAEKFGGKAIREQKEANAAFATANSELATMNTMLDEVNRKLNEKTPKPVEDLSAATEEAANAFERLRPLVSKALKPLQTKELQQNVIGGIKQIGPTVREQMQIAQNSLNQSQQAMRGFAMQMASVFEGIFTGLLQGTLNFKQMMGDALKSVLAKAVALLAVFGILTALTGGVGGAFFEAVGGLKGFMSAGFNLPTGAFADGGIVSGPTLGLVGEYPGAKTNPEVIAPLDKLRGMLGGQHVQVTGKISGRDILLTSERNAIDRNRVRGF